MALIKQIGRSGKISYGTGSTLEFRVAFLPLASSNPTGLQYINGQLNTVGLKTSDPVAGTITVAGTAVTLADRDLESPSHVANKIASTAIAGYTVYAKKDVVYLTNTTIGVTAKPTVVLGTATGILFVDSVFTSGTTAPAGALDDILVLGRTPLTLTLAFTGGTTPTVQTSTGTEIEQAQGILSYGTAVSFTGGVATITAPVNYVRVTNAGGSTQATLYITR